MSLAWEAVQMVVGIIITLTQLFGAVIELFLLIYMYPGVLQQLKVGPLPSSTQFLRLYSSFIWNSPAAEEDFKREKAAELVEKVTALCYSLYHMPSFCISIVFTITSFLYTLSTCKEFL